MRYPERRPKTPQRANDTAESSVEDQPSKSAPTGARLRGLAFAMLGRREHSEQELRDKLLALSAEPTEVAAIIEEFKSECYQSDQRMAEMIVRANIRKGRGPARAKKTLRERHVDQELAEDDLEKTNWLALARDLRAKKFGSALPTDAKEQARQLRFLQYRGFDGQTCSQAVRNHEPDE